MAKKQKKKRVDKKNLRIKDIVVNFVPHELQLYNTVGNYGECHNEIWFTISMMSDWRYMMLVLVHELVEYTLIKYRGIKIDDINNFDIAFEKARKKKKAPFDEPGDDQKAPYHKEHQTASQIEQILARDLGVNWQLYDKEVDRQMASY